MTQSTPIQLIVGLGNPGPEYEQTRHNAGAWFVEKLAEDAEVILRPENKFKALYGKIRIASQDCYLMIPQTFMNLSGQAVRGITQYFKIPTDAILVAHDELDLDPGTARLKFDGGHGGHNGLRDIISQMGSRQFNRLRLGIGHPGNANQVVDYVLKQPNHSDKIAIDHAIADSCSIIDSIVQGDMQKAMKQLHTL